MKLYLAYGANTSFEKMAVRCPAAKYICNLALNNHKLMFRGVADVVWASGKHVDCAVWLITPECEASLDRYEGFPNTYVKKYVRVTFGGRQHRVMFYVMRQARQQYLPRAEYEKTLRDGYADCGLPSEQIDSALKRVEEWNKKWAATQPKYEEGQLPLPLPSKSKGTWFGTPVRGRVETEAERERRQLKENEERDEKAAEEFFMSMYGKHDRSRASNQ